MRRKDDYVMMGRATPKRVTLPDCRTFVARYKRVPRSRLPPHIKIRRRCRGAPARQRGTGIMSVIKILLSFGKKATKKNHHQQCCDIINKILYDTKKFNEKDNIVTLVTVTFSRKNYHKLSQNEVE